MKFAAAVGACGLPHFAELNVCTLRSVFGRDLPVVICDDLSNESHEVERVAARRDCYYQLNEVPLGHFQGDVQAFMSALCLAESEKADIAIKMSQRCCVAHPDVRSKIESTFAQNPALAVICPGRPNPNYIRQGHQQFARFPCLTDVFFMRTSAITPEFIRDEYLKQVRNGKQYHDCFVEVFWWKVFEGPLQNRFHLEPMITDMRWGLAPYVLRRYQCSVADYAKMADRFGITSGVWDLGERAKMVRRYDPRPKAF